LVEINGLAVAEVTGFLYDRWKMKRLLDDA
jgi:hypothetical protein